MLLAVLSRQYASACSGYKEAACTYELGKRPGFCDVTVVEHKNAIGVAQRRQAMGDEHDGTVRALLL